MSLWVGFLVHFSRWSQNAIKLPSAVPPGANCGARARNYPKCPSGVLLRRFLALGANVLQNHRLGSLLGRFFPLGPEMLENAPLGGFLGRFLALRANMLQNRPLGSFLGRFRALELEMSKMAL